MPLFLKHSGRGEVELQEHSIPTPAEGQLLVKVVIAGGNPVDSDLNSTIPLVGTTVGYDFAGTVESLGPAVSCFNIGDRVAGYSFGHASPNPAWGAFGEYCIGWNYLTFKIPESMSFEEAATLPVGLTVAGLSLGKELALKKGDSGPLLVVGGATNMGAIAIQYAKAIGISPIVAVASKKNEALVKSLGADEFVDYALPEDEYIAKVKSVTPGLKHALDARSTVETLVLTGKIVGPGGKVVALNPPPDEGTPQDVEYAFVNSFAIFGVDYNVFGIDFAADSDSQSFLKDWFQNTADKLVTGGAIKPHGYKVVDGGLLGVREGWELYDAKAVSAQKLIYRVGDTEGIKK
ncbi:GroES-like protein [Ascodesmis nigricans]|uniref:GroES-like protein n=1 Tax=Ascodesmis nigricans TaxID=341454 RepID=A0A4S2MYE3_9PEZI|nr:GroES-like protein [Ascodesmis nigricans]